MLDAEKLATQFLQANPHASLAEAKEHAASIDGADAGFVKEFYIKFFDQKTKIAQSKSEVDRIWPEDKGY